MSIEKVLKQLESDWEDAEVRSSEGYFTPEDGAYVALLKSGSVEISQNDRLQVVWELQMTEGKNKGASWKKFDGIDNPMGMSFVKGTLESVGIDVPSKITDLPKAIKNFFKENEDGVLVNVTVKTKNEFTNTYINGLAEDEVKKKDEAGEDDVPDFSEMSKKMLVKFIDSHELNVDPDDYADVDDLAAAVRKAYKAKKEKPKKKKSRFED
jgi:hypothetical protein